MRNDICQNNGAEKQQSTYEGFDFAKKWSVSPDVNDGYPYYDPKAEQVILKVKPVIADKEWNTANAKDKNKYGKTDTYYYPYYGDDDGTVTGVEFTDLTKEQQEYVTKYGISVSCDPKEDVESAKIDMNFLGSPTCQSNLEKSADHVSCQSRSGRRRWV